MTVDRRRVVSEEYDGSPPIQASQREMFRTIALTSYHKWPAYDSTPLYDRNSLDGLEEDIQTVARAWFEHDAHESVKEFENAVLAWRSRI